MPSLEELNNELRREKFHRRHRKLLRSAIYALVVVAAVSVLIATLLLPVLEIYGTSMKPNLTEGDIVVSVKSATLEKGDIITLPCSAAAAVFSSPIQKTAPPRPQHQRPSSHRILDPIPAMNPI